MSTKALSLARLLFAGATIAVAACGSGGGDSSPSPAPLPPPPSPSLQVLPASYDFGKVTPNGSPAPLEVTIKNNGNAALNVSGILFQPGDPSFILNPSLGTKPCASVSPTVAAGDSCTVQVAFQPSAIGSFTSTLRITSNDATSPSFGLPIQGVREDVASLLVRINQLSNACPGNLATAYVSVTDQGGFPVLGLTQSNFSVTQTPATPSFTVAFIDAVYTPIAISATLDHSGSLTDQAVAFADMKTGFTNVFASLRAGDVGEVIKFDDVVQTVQPFTMDKLQLQAAIAAPYDMGRNTKLYDAVYQAIDETATQTSHPRKAVIVATDGVDEGPTSPFSTHPLTEVIAYGVSKNVPVFTVGLGASINTTVLQQMASGTGGVFYQSNSSQNLATIYQQLSSLLYERQYVLTFTATGNPATTKPVTIAATSGGVNSNPATKSVTTCP